MYDHGDADPKQTNQPPHNREGRSDVGYKRPPKHTQFKKGHSGNPRGRPRGSKNLNVLFRELLEETVPVSISGQTTRMPLGGALVTSALNRALKGDKAAFDFVLLVAEKTGRLDDPSSLGNETGIVILPERAESYEEWEAKHGADARGDKYFRSDGQRRPAARVSTVKAGDELFTAGNIPEAFATYRRALGLRKRPLEKCETSEERDRLLEVVNRMWRVVQSLLSSGQYKEALDASVIIEAAAPQEPAFYSLRFYALILLGRIDEARNLLDRFKGQMWMTFETEDGSHELPWEAGLIEGFFLIRNAGVNDPLLDEIEHSYEQEQRNKKKGKKQQRRKRSDPGSVGPAELSEDDPARPK